MLRHPGAAGHSNENCGGRFRRHRRRKPLFRRNRDQVGVLDCERVAFAGRFWRREPKKKGLVLSGGFKRSATESDCSLKTTVWRSRFFINNPFRERKALPRRHYENVVFEKGGGRNGWTRGRRVRKSGLENRQSRMGGGDRNVFKNLSRGYHVLTI